MSWLVLAIVLTLSISFACSLAEAIILSTTVAEIEALKRAKPGRGRLLEKLKHGLDETISAILTLNTIANTFGSMIIGVLAAHLFGDAMIGLFSAALALTILVFAEVIPKNLGVIHRVRLQPLIVYPLRWAQRLLFPIIWL
jgi:Mg2+/Co2+ transporter CorB